MAPLLPAWQQLSITLKSSYASLCWPVNGFIHCVLKIVLLGSGPGCQMGDTESDQARDSGPSSSAPGINNGLITRGRLNTYQMSSDATAAGRNTSSDIKTELIEYMEQDDTGTGIGTGEYDYDEVFFLGGTDPFANSEDDDEEEEEQLIIDGNEDLLDDSDNDPDGVQKNLKQKPVVRKRKNSDPIKLDLGQLFKTVRAARSAASCLRQLKPNDRIRFVNVQHNLKARTSVTQSFDPLSGKCNTCLVGRHEALLAGGEPIVVVAADQCFPACVPARSAGKECLRIIRTEDATLQDITHSLADAIGRGRLAKYSVILLGSASHLASSCTEHYLFDWVRSRWWIRERLGMTSASSL
jgi:hypothetical protein